MAKIKCDQCDYSHARPQVVGAHKRREHGVAGTSASVVSKREHLEVATVPAEVKADNRTGRLDYDAMIASLKQEWQLLTNVIRQLQSLQELHNK